MVLDESLFEEKEDKIKVIKTRIKEDTSKNENEQKIKELPHVISVKQSGMNEYELTTEVVDTSSKARENFREIESKAKEIFDDRLRNVTYKRNNINRGEKTFNPIISVEIKEPEPTRIVKKGQLKDYKVKGRENKIRREGENYFIPFYDFNVVTNVRLHEIGFSTTFSDSEGRDVFIDDINSDDLGIYLIADSNGNYDINLNLNNDLDLIYLGKAKSNIVENEKVDIQRVEQIFNKWLNTKKLVNESLKENLNKNRYTLYVQYEDEEDDNEFHEEESMWDLYDLVEHAETFIVPEIGGGDISFAYIEDNETGEIVWDASEGYYIEEDKGLKESKLVEGIKTFLNDLGKEDIQYFKLTNKFNYDIKQLRVDNKNKTYEVGQFKIIKRPYMTNNGAEFKRLIAELSARGYTEVGNKLTESEDMTREQARERCYKIKKNWDGKYVAITEDLLLNPTKEDEENVKELIDKYKGTKYEKILNDLKAKYDFEETAKEQKRESMKKSKFIENLEEPEISKVNPKLIKELENKVVELGLHYGYDDKDLKIETHPMERNKIYLLVNPYVSQKRQADFIRELESVIRKYDENARFTLEVHGRWVVEVNDKIEESVEGDKIAQDYIDSKNANYEADKQADREAKVELAKQGITEELSEFEKRAKDTADKLGIEIKLRGNDRFDLETLDRETLEKFYKELLGVELGNVKGLKEDVEESKEIADVEVPVVVVEEPKEEEQPTEEEQTIGLTTVINKLIADELEAIDEYNSAIVTFETEGRGEFTDVFRSILEDEQHHMGNLEKLLNELDPSALANIKKGQLEAETQLVDAEHPLDESLKK